jgi:CBS domain-containing membrane protein
MQQTPDSAHSRGLSRLIFRPLLAGATLRDRLLASLAALVGIALTAFICGLFLGQGPHLIWLVPPMGASAVLLFAVPASPLAQPWPAIGGNVISALVGIAVSRVVHEPALAAGIAVGGAIAAMSVLRCIHPPGGAAALVAVFGGPAVASAGFMFPFMPVGINAVLLVGTALLYHRFSGHAYPHRPAAPAPSPHGTADTPAPQRAGASAEDIARTLAAMGETFDISLADLQRVVRAVEAGAVARSFDSVATADIMSRDILAVRAADDPATARRILLERDLRTLPVVDEQRRVVGVVGFPELATDASLVAEVMAEPILATAQTPAIDLAAPLTDGRTHAVVVVDAEKRLLGMVTQTDLLAVLSRGVTAPAAAEPR